MKRCSKQFMKKFQNIRLKGVDYEPQKSNVEKWGWPGSIPSFILNREKDHINDPNAIGVYFTIDRIGYIPKELAAELAPKMDQGHQFDAILEKRNTSLYGTKVGLTVSIVEVF
jgi:hypothetical protein